MMPNASFASQTETDTGALVAALAARGDAAPEFTAEMAADLIGVTLPRVRPVIQRMVRQGRVVVAMAGAGGRPSLYTLTEPAETAPAAPGRTAADNMWAAIRKLPKFTVTAVFEHARIGDAPVTERAVRSYVRALLAGGYLAVRQKARNGREAVYALKPGQGARAPRLCRVAAIVDPNTNTTTVIGGGA